MGWPEFSGDEKKMAQSGSGLSQSEPKIETFGSGRVWESLERRRVRGHEQRIHGE